MNTTNRVAALLSLLKSAFPPRPFDGDVTVHLECDNGRAFIHSLSGKAWRQISFEFVLCKSLSLSLLTDRALAAFLPAWLNGALRARDNDDDDACCCLVEFVAYFLCRHGEGVEGRDPGERRVSRTVALFDEAQCHAICRFLCLLRSHSAANSLREELGEGVRLWCPTECRPNDDGRP